MQKLKIRIMAVMLALVFAVTQFITAPSRVFAYEEGNYTYSQQPYEGDYAYGYGEEDDYADDYYEDDDDYTDDCDYVKEDYDADDYYGEDYNYGYDEYPYYEDDYTYEEEEYGYKEEDEYEEEYPEYPLPIPYLLEVAPFNVTEPLDFRDRTENDSGMGWAWNNANNTLTLTALDMTVTGGNTPPINLPANSTIVLNGANTIVSTSIVGAIQQTAGGTLNMQFSLGASLAITANSLSVNGDVISTGGTGSPINITGAGGSTMNITTTGRGIRAASSGTDPINITNMGGVTINSASMGLWTRNLTVSGSIVDINVSGTAANAFAIGTGDLFNAQASVSILNSSTVTINDNVHVNGVRQPGGLRTHDGQVPVNVSNSTLTINNVAWGASPRTTQLNLQDADFGQNQQGNGWFWNATTNVLTLNNFESATTVANINLPETATIRMLGENTLTTTSNSAATIQQGGAASMTNPQVNITGTGTLDINAPNLNPNISPSPSAVNLRSLTINSGTINIDTNAHGLGAPVVAGTSLVIAGGTVDIDAPNGNGISLLAAGGSVAIEGGTVKIDAGANGISTSSNVRIEGGNVRIDADGRGILTSFGNITIRDSEVNIDAGGNGIESGGSAAQSVVEIAGSNVNIINAGGNGIQSNASVTITGGSEVNINADYDGIRATNNVTITGGSDVIIDADENGVSARNVTIGNSEVAIDAGTNGVYVNNDAGSVTIDADSSITINAGEEGIYDRDGAANINIGEGAITPPTTPPNGGGNNQGGGTTPPNGGGNNNQGGGSTTTTSRTSRRTPTPAPATSISSGISSVGDISISVTNRNVTINLPNTTVTELVNNAEYNTITFDLSGVSRAGAAIIPRSAARAIAEAGLGIAFDLRTGSISLNSQAVSTIAQAGRTNNSVSVSIQQTNRASLTEAQNEALEGRYTIYTVTAHSGTAFVANIGGTATVTLPFRGTAATVWLLANDGTRTVVPSTLNADNNTVTFTTSNLGTFIVS